MPITSRIEQARDEIVTEFEGITTGNGYRTSPTVLSTINPIDRIRKFPEIGIELGDITIEPIDQSWVVHNVRADVWIQGAVTADTDTGTEATNINEAAEALRHDIMRKIGELLNKFLTHSGSRWNIVPDRPITCSTLQLLGERRNRGVFFAKFQVMVRSTNNTFTATVSGGDDGPSADVIIDGNAV